MMSYRDQQTSRETHGDRSGTVFWYLLRYDIRSQLVVAWTIQAQVDGSHGNQ